MESAKASAIFNEYVQMTERAIAGARNSSCGPRRPYRSCSKRIARRCTPDRDCAASARPTPGRQRSTGCRAAAEIV